MSFEAAGTISSAPNVAPVGDAPSSREACPCNRDA